MSDVWYVRVRGEVRGPMPHEELLSQIRKKRLGRHHEVSRDGVQWQRAGELRELFEPTISVLQPAGGASAGGSAAGDARVDPAGSAGMSPRETTWFYAKGGSRNGPISETELLALIAAGQLAPTDLVWSEQLESWTPLKQVPRLFSIASNTSGNAPPQSTNLSREAASMTSTPTTVPLLTSSLFALLFACMSLLAVPLIFVLSTVISGSAAFSYALLIQGGGAGVGMLAVLISAMMYGAMPLFSAVAGIFVGHYSLKFHRDNPGTHVGTGFALAALIICYAILALTALVVLVSVIVAGVKAA